MNDEGRDGRDDAHAKPTYLVLSARNRCSLVSLYLERHTDTLKVCSAAFLCVGSDRV